MNCIRKQGILQQFSVRFRECRNLFIAGDAECNVIRDLKARILSHGLYLGDEFAHKALFDERFGKRNVKHHGDTVVLRGDIAL